MNINDACRCKKKKRDVRSSGKILTEYGKRIYNSKYINKRNNNTKFNSM